MIAGSSYYSSQASNSKAEDDYDISWSSGEASSPTSSEDSENSATSPSRPITRNTSSSTTSSLHSPPASPPSKLATKAHPYRPAMAPPSRPLRPRGLAPLTPQTGLPLGTGALPKAQPLSRALFARKANDVPHAGMNSKKKGGSQKIIVPTKGFKTTFELDLTASELARR